jgi:MFS family permease
MLYATVAQVTPAVVVATAMGALSDRYGRKSSLVLAASAGLVEAAVIVAVSADGRKEGVGGVRGEEPRTLRTQEQSSHSYTHTYIPGP